MRGLRVIAVRLVHLPEINVADAHLRLRGLRRVGEEHAEVRILRLGLGQRRRAALLVPAIRDRQLGAHLVLRVGIGIQQRLQVQPRHIVVALARSRDRLVVQLLIRQLRVHPRPADRSSSVFLTLSWCPWTRPRLSSFFAASCRRLVGDVCTVCVSALRPPVVVAGRLCVRLCGDTGAHRHRRTSTPAAVVTPAILPACGNLGKKNDSSINW